MSPKRIPRDKIEMIIAMHCAGLPQTYISGELGVSKSAVRCYVESGSPKHYFGSIAKGLGHEDYYSYMKSRAEKRGHNSYHAYRRFLEQRKKEIIRILMDAVVKSKGG